MKDAIGYLRVSTKEQGRSGLSLAAQRFDIEDFGKREGFAITAWHQDVHTGVGRDPLSLRPGLAGALKEARGLRCPLIVSRLDRRARAYRVYVEWALRQPGINGRPICFAAAARRLNDRGIETPFGGHWRGHHLDRMARRLGIDHPLGRMPERLARARVRAVFERDPEITAPRAVAALGKETPYPLHDRTAYALLKESRLSVATRSPLHQKVGWRIDLRTVARVRIARIWQSHPQYTGKQVIEALGPEPPHFVGLKWVQAILHDCWRAAVNAGPKRSRVGRRDLDPWRNHALPLKSRVTRKRPGQRSEAWKSRNP